MNVNFMVIPAQIHIICIIVLLLIYYYYGFKDLFKKKVVESDRKRVCRNKSDILCNIKVTTENKKKGA